MPCSDSNSYRGYDDYIKKMKDLVGLIEYIHNSLNIKIPPEIIEIKNNDFLLERANHFLTDYLCSSLRHLKSHNKDWYEFIVYNSKLRKSRDLANWWEDHQEKDKIK